MTREWLTVILGPLVTGLVTALSVLAREWLQRRDREQRGRRQMQVAKERVDFVDAWVAAQERLAPDAATDDLRSAARAELAEALQVARSAWVQAAPREATVDLQGALRSIVLACPLTGRPARALRVVYWCSLVWAGFWAGIGLDITLVPESGLSDWVLLVMMVLAFAVAPAWALRAWTLRVSGRAEARRQAPVVIDVRRPGEQHDGSRQAREPGRSPVQGSAASAPLV